MFLPGALALWVTFFALIASTVFYVRSLRGHEAARSWGRQMYALGTLSVVIAAAALLFLILRHDFRFHYVFSYSDRSLPLPYLIDRDILLAYKMNGAEMIPERGFPFALVAEDKWGYKWIKWVTGIEVSNDTSFRGYWESNGYSNDGDLSKPMYEYPAPAGEPPDAR